MSGERNSFDNFEELYTNCYWLVYRYVRHMVEKDLAAAEDVTQEVFLVAYQKWQEVRRHPNQKGFLLLTAKNKLKKLEDLCKVRDASSLKDDIYPEYHVCEATVITKKRSNLYLYTVIFIQRKVKNSNQ